MNFSWRREDIPLNYLFVTDGRVDKTSEIPFTEGFKRIQERIFIGIYVPRKEWITLSENYSLKQNVSRFYYDGNMKNKRIYKDICYHPVEGSGTIVHCALIFSLFAYAKEIYLVGCDTSRREHFYDKVDQGNQVANNDLSMHIIKVVYAQIKMFAKHYYPDTEIFSINPIGLKGLFSDVYTEDYLASLNEGK